MGLLPNGDLCFVLPRVAFNAKTMAGLLSNGFINTPGFTIPAEHMKEIVSRFPKMKIPIGPNSIRAGSYAVRAGSRGDIVVDFGNRLGAIKPPVVVKTR
jgi:hypothetical protein